MQRDCSTTPYPLYQLKSGDYELPISLDYIAKGVKVSDPEGLIGQIGHLILGVLLLEQCVVDLLTRHLGLVIYGQKMLLLHWSRMRGVWGFVDGRRVIFYCRIQWEEGGFYHSHE